MRTSLLRTLTLTFAAIICPTATLAQKTINIPADQPTIQAGINAAATGDTVLVAPGTYYENIVIDSKEIIVRSVAGAAKTILDGSKSTVVLIANNTSTATIIDGFTIRNGATPYTPAYAGVDMEVGGGTLINNTIIGNYGNAITANFGSLVAMNNHIITTAPDAGQLYCHASTGISIFGILDGTRVNPTVSRISGNLIEGDGTLCSGPGIYALSNTVLIENNTIRNNLYGISAYVLSADIRQNLVYNNQQGGLYIQFQLGTFPPTDPPADFVVNNTFYNNQTNTSNFNTYEKQHSADVTLALLDAKISLSNNLIVGTSSTGPAFACTDEMGMAYKSNTTPAILDHNDIVNIGSTPYATLILGDCSDVNPTQIGLNGNLSVDPRFAGSSDFHLLAGSPAIDAGNNSAVNLPATDFSANPRILDSNGNGHPVVDMGIYEAGGLADAAPVFLTLTSSSYYLTPPTSATLTATINSTLPVPAGVINFFRDDVAIGSVSFVAGAAPKLPVTFPKPGLYRFTATYGGGGGLAPAISTVIYIRVLDYQPVIRLASSPNPSTLGSPVTFTATITSPDGAVPSPVVFNEGTTQLATQATDATGTATFVTSSLSLGYHTITATYSGDTTHYSATATVTQQVISGYATTTTLISSPNPSATSQPVTFTAHVAAQTTSTSGTPTGAVTFTDGSNSLATLPLDSNNNAIITTSTLTAGAHSITATYVPTGNFAASSASLNQTVNGLAATATLTAAPATSNFGTPVTLTATVAAAAPSTQSPTGIVTFCYVTTVLGQPTCTGTVLASVPLSAAGIATLTYSAFPVGVSNLGCIYKGDTTFNGISCNAVAITVNAPPSALALTASTTAATVLTPITFNALLTAGGTPVPIEVIRFTADGNALGLATTASPSGIAPFSWANLSPGQHSIVATFDGDSTHLAATSAPVIVTITSNPTTITLIAAPSPGYQNQPITLAATVGSVTAPAGVHPFGTVTLLDSATTLATLTITASQPASAVTLTTSTLAPGTHTLTATFTPLNAAFLAVTSAPLTLVVLPQGYTLTTDPPSITIQTEHHRSLTVSLTSIGGLTGAFKLSCGTLPEAASCTWGQTTVQLPPNGTVSTPLTLDTDVVPNFKSSLAHPVRTGIGVYAPISLALLLPPALFPTKRRRTLRHLLPLWFLSATALYLTACSSKYPDHTPPGTYTIPLTATAADNANTPPQTINLTLVVSP